jgi:LDH2 family malate/lactate/ureidoglycolate dehydrogenase
VGSAGARSGPVDKSSSVGPPVLVDASELQQLTQQVLVAHGASPEHASLVAQSLVGANLRGVDTHGLWLLPMLVRAIKAGELDPIGMPAITQEAAAFALVRGRWTFGHVAATLATNVAVEKALAVGVGVVGVVEAHHMGRLGEYVERAIEREVILLMLQGGQGEEIPHAAPYGGSRAVLHTNPIAIGFPVGTSEHFVLDIATSAISGVKVFQARERGEMVPPGCIVDSNGRPTIDPGAFFNGGAHVPFGGYKGFGFMLAAELLGRVLTGADNYASGERGGPFFRHCGTLMIAVRADVFDDRASVATRAKQLADRVRAVPPADGFDRVQIPGDPEERILSVRVREGIPLPVALWQELNALASGKEGSGIGDGPRQ